MVADYEPDPDLIQARRDLELRGLIECVGLRDGQPVYAVTAKGRLLDERAREVAATTGEDEAIVWDRLCDAEPLIDRP